MVDRIMKMFMDMQIEQTATGKALIVLDTFGVLLSAGYYILNVGSFINSVCPPIILVLTIISLFTSIIYKAWFEYRSWEKRKKGGSDQVKDE